MPEEFVEYHPPVVGRKFVRFEFLGLRVVNERILLRLAFSDHTVGNDNVLKTGLLPNIIVLVCINISEARSVIQ